MSVARIHARGPARLIGILIVMGALVLGLSQLVSPAGAAPAPPAAAPVPAVGRVRLGYLPDGLGATSDFTYDFDGVRFAARVWESATADGGSRVDLHVMVMRGRRLSTPARLRTWFVTYEQRDPQPVYRPVHVHGHRGWACADEVVWLVRPGLAVSVRLDTSRWPASDVLRIARAASAPGE